MKFLTNVVFLASEEDKTASLIHGFLQTLDSEKFTHSIENSLPKVFPDIFILDLDYALNLPDFFSAFKNTSFDGDTIAYCLNPEQVSSELKKCFPILLSREQIALDLSRKLSDLQKIAEFKKHFQHLSEQIIGMSQKKKELIQQVKQILKKKVFTLKKNQSESGIVLIQGESGSGKELVAHLVACGQTPFVSVNCSAIPETLFDSELFGHVKGAFTGADKDRKGLFEEAHGGVLYLDEIGEVPLATQAKLLRALQEGEIRRVGASVNTRISVRIIAATNRDLHQNVLQGKFREDLYYRLSVFPLYVPALRERPSDIPLLAHHFAKIYAGKEISFTDKAMILLQNHNWPGNIRELENVIHRAVVLSDSDILDTKDFPQLTKKTQTENPNLPFKWDSMTYQEFCSWQKEQELKFLETRLRTTDNSVSKVSNELEMGRTFFYSRIKRLKELSNKKS